MVHLALGLQDRMVGTATWTDRIRPNLAPSHGENRDDESGDGPRTKPLRLSTIQTEVRQLAQIFDVRAKGEALAADLQRRLEQVRADNAARDPKEISIASWFANTESPYVAGCCGSSGIISRAAGVRNVFADTQDEFPQVSWETMLDRDPTVLVLGDLQRKSQTGDKLADKIRFLETDPVTKRLTAVRKKRYVILNGADMNPSIRTVDGAEKVSAGIRRLGLVR
ncbi:ABC transporter substrate-binding protein [Patulibacter sp. NPDC049589]|uniref:ABC transporter substrate-binding protein n=1 Tax=Patulibacter sp. NPDC049589 TaxID=3154731 RepID=UPI00341D6FB0